MKTRNRTILLIAAATTALPMSALLAAQDAKPVATPMSGDELKKVTAPGAPAGATPATAQPAPITPPTPGQAPAALSNALKLEFEKFDFGDIADTEPVSKKITFTNVSDKTITIAVAASCGCTTAGLEKTTYAPGEQGSVTAQFNPAGRAGPQTKSLTFTVTNPQGAFNQQMVTITSNVKALVQFDPPKLFLNEVDHRKGQTTRLTVTGRKPDFRVTKAEAQSEFVKTKVLDPEVSEVNGEKLVKQVIEIEIGKGAPIGNFSSQLAIAVNDERAKIQPYFLGADVIGDVKSTPPQAILRVNTPGTPFNTQIRLDSRSGTAFNITSIETEGPQDMKLVTDFTKNDEGRSYLVTVSGVTPNRPGMIQGYLVVSTDAQGGESMKVPFTAVIRNPEQIAQPVAPASQPAKPAGN